MIPEIVATLMALGTNPRVVTEGQYTRYELPDSCRVEVVDYGDSALVVETVCAPICSSRARIYNKDNHLIRTITPTIQGIFPYATLDEHYVLHWVDNTDLILDKEEKK